jgi:hypothetical protein
VHRASSKPFRCDIVYEKLTVSLRRRRSPLASGDLYIHRSRTDRRRVDANAPLDPLTLDLSAAGIAARECERRE